MENFVYRLEENEVDEATPSDATPTDAWCDLLEFDSGDVKYYTVEAQADSSAAQTVAYLVDRRNILLIFLLIYKQNFPYYLLLLKKKTTLPIK